MITTNEISIYSNGQTKNFDIEREGMKIINILPKPSEKEFDHILDILELLEEGA